MIRISSPSVISAVILLILLPAALLCGCIAGPVTSDAEQAYEQAMNEYQAGDYPSAEALFSEAYNLAEAEGDTEMAISAKREMFRTNNCYIEYSLTAAQAEDAMREMIAGITDDEIKAWLDERAQKIVTGGETLYFSDIAEDYLYAHPEIIRKQMAGAFDFDKISFYAFSGESPNTEKIRYAGFEKLVIPGHMIPDEGTIRIWYPLPVDTGYQTEISVTNISYPEYAMNGPVTTGGIGYIYYEIPAEKIEDELVISADLAFTSYGRGYDIDPAMVGEYDTADPDYIRYTTSERNIEVTDETRELAEKIVGDETNPYLQAGMIYSYIIDTYPYSKVPHLHIDSIQPKVAESTHMLETGHGDCGTQGMFFSALCRSLGIPARTTGGYQMLIFGNPSSHFWAEYYLPGYGWIPVDPTMADVSDWVDIPEKDRAAFRDYYAENLDPARMVIQKNVDAAMEPPLPDDAVVFRLVRQYPAIVADTAEYNMGVPGEWTFEVNLASAG